MTSKYAIALYELVQLRTNLDRCVETFPLARFRELLGVPPGAYERGANFAARVTEPALLEVNGLSDIERRSDLNSSQQVRPDREPSPSLGGKSRVTNSGLLCGSGTGRRWAAWRGYVVV